MPKPSSTKTSKKPSAARRKTVDAIQHADAKRKNIPTAECQRC